MKRRIQFWILCRINNIKWTYRTLSKINISLLKPQAVLYGLALSTPSKKLPATTAAKTVNTTTYFKSFYFSKATTCLYSDLSTLSFSIIPLLIKCKLKVIIILNLIVFILCLVQVKTMEEL